tara:strand:- start:842 stop:1462 length:621 start_codon:yes stop_codon:yes gene_type:complete
MINSVYENWKNKVIGDAEMAVYFFLYYHQQKYPNIKLQRALESDESYAAILNRFVFKKVKFKAVEALKRWSSGEWKFKLVDSILLPKDVLYYQSLGIRPVTIKVQDSLEPILHKADCLEFFIHDLEHGYMFFHDEKLRQMQLKFFKEIHSRLDLEVWTKYNQSERFQYRFNYLISDMNTHLEHYKSYLYAMIEPSDRIYFEDIFKD